MQHGFFVGGVAAVFPVFGNFGFEGGPVAENERLAVVFEPIFAVAGMAAAACGRIWP